MIIDRTGAFGTRSKMAFKVVLSIALSIFIAQVWAHGHRQNWMNVIATDIDIAIVHSSITPWLEVSGYTIVQRRDIEDQLRKHALQHWIPAIRELFDRLSGAEQWLDDDAFRPEKQLEEGLERIGLLTGRARDGAMCELVTQLLAWNVAVKKKGEYWNPLKKPYAEFVRDSDLTSGWMHYKRNCPESDTYRWLIKRVQTLTEIYKR